MLLCTHPARRFTALVSILLMLAGMLVSGPAKAAHYNGMVDMAMAASSAAPCHPLAASAAASDPAGTFDHCLELCLSQKSDTAIIAAPASKDVVLVVLHPSSEYTIHNPQPVRAARTRADTRDRAVPTPPRALYLITQRLLI